MLTDARRERRPRSPTGSRRPDHSRARTSPPPSPCCATSLDHTRPEKEPRDRTRTTHHRPLRRPKPSILKQPRAVWAVAFACVIAFMGIGLVDPILKPIADQLDATPSQVSLLFTSYMAVMGVAMLITGVVSSRIGAKRTLLAGLALIIVFSALAGLLGHHRRHRRLPGRLGPRQRAVHRHRAGHHRDRRRAARSRRRSSCSRRRSASASRRARSSAASSADLLARRRSSASPC